MSQTKEAPLSNNLLSVGAKCPCNQATTTHNPNSAKARCSRILSNQLWWQAWANIWTPSTSSTWKPCTRPRCSKRSVRCHSSCCQRRMKSRYLIFRWRLSLVIRRLCFSSARNLKIRCLTTIQLKSSCREPMFSRHSWTSSRVAAQARTRTFSPATTSGTFQGLLKGHCLCLSGSSRTSISLL